MYQHNRLKGYLNDYLVLRNWLFNGQELPLYGIQLTGAEKGTLKRFLKTPCDEGVPEDTVKDQNGELAVFPYRQRFSWIAQGKLLRIRGLEYELLPSSVNKSVSESKMIGEGGSGAVYSACDKRTNHLVAIKLFRSKALWQQEHKHNETLKAKGAPMAFVTAINSGCAEVGQSRFFAIVYEQGLDQVQSVAKLPVTNLIEQLLQLVKALAWLHDTGHFHGDFKFDNLVYSSSGHGLALIDFGRTTNNLKALPNPTYWSPDFENGEVSDKTEVLALGSCLFSIFSHRYLFSKVSPGNQFEPGYVSQVTTPVYQKNVLGAADWDSEFLLSSDELRRLELGIYCREFLPNQKRALDRLFRGIKSMVCLDAKRRPSARQLVTLFEQLQGDVL